MKLGFDAKRYFNNSTGLGNYARWLVHSLKNSSYQIHLFHTKNTNATSVDDVHNPKGFNKLWPSLWRIKFICNDLKKNGIQIYHGLSNELPFGIHHTGIKTVVTIHDVINKKFPENYSAIDRWIYDRKLGYASKYADAIVTPSAATKKDLKEYYALDENKIHVIPLSLPPKIASSKKEERAPYILCVSSFNTRKNIAKLIKAYLSLDTDTSLILAGAKGDTYKYIKSITANKDQIELRTDLSKQALANLYAGALFCVYPSVYEGFGIPILEAFQYGKTCATSATSSMPEVGGNAAKYFNPNEDKSIAEAIKALLNKNVREKFEQEIPTQLAHFEDKKTINKYEELYASLISN